MDLAAPFVPILSPCGHQVPEAFRTQCLGAAGEDQVVALRGKMHRVWHKQILRPLFRLLGQAGILVPFTGRYVPCVFRVIPDRLAGGRPCQRWKWTFYFHRTVHFNTTVLYDETLGLIGDLVGPRDAMYIAWRAGFQPPARFTLDTEKCAFRLGDRFFWLPDRLWPLAFGVVCFVQEVDETRRDIVHVDLRLTHPWFGEIFGYAGTFQVKVVPAGGAG